MLDDPELLDEFVEEARDHLVRIESILSSIDPANDTDDFEPINDVFRGMHSIKGAAGLLELPNIREVSHAAETVLASVRSGDHALDLRTIEALLGARDRLSEMVEDLANEGLVDATVELRVLNNLLTREEEAPTPQVPVDALPEVEETPFVEPHREPGTPRPRDPEQNKALPAKRADGPAGDSVRVPLAVLDRLMALAGELVLVRNRTRQNFEEKMQRDRNLATGADRRLLQQLDLVTSELQEAVLRTRMQPIRKVFSKIPKLCRDLGKKLDKQIRSVSVGDEVEVDKTILECLSDPLLHLIRNACDHGLETATERHAAGKPPEGTLTVAARHDAGQISITIADDGRGVNTDKVAEKAIAQGIRRPDELASMSEKQISALIFAPGFSTADTVTDVSGRGVGMDVVRTSIEGIGGSVDVHSRRGEGTTFTLRVPLSLAIVSSLIVRNDGETFAIPQVNLDEVVRLHRDEGNGEIEFVNEQPVVRVRGNLIPIVHLGDALEHRDSIPTQVLTDRAAASNEIPVLTIAIVRVGELRFGIIVDEAVGSEEIVVKPNHSALGEQRCFVGSTILGDGRVALILDVNGICDHAKLQKRFFESSVPAENTAGAVEQAQELLFTIDGEDRFLVNLSLVSRVVPIGCEQLKRTEGIATIDLPEGTVRVVLLDKYFQSRGYRPKNDEYLLILPRHMTQPIGFLASSILDVVALEREIDPDLHRTEHVLGSTMLDGEVCLVVDLFSLARAEVPDWFHEVKPKAALDQPKLLLAEDTAFFRKAVKNYLAEMGYEVDVAADGAEALEILLQDNDTYAALVSDLQMPKLDGFGLIEQVRNVVGRPALSQIPALALSALSSPEDQRRALAAGFDRFEIKLNRGSLEDAIVEILELRKKEAAA